MQIFQQSYYFKEKTVLCGDCHVYEMFTYFYKEYHNE
jgi:hypothetical protein